MTICICGEPVLGVDGEVWPAAVAPSRKAHMALETLSQDPSIFSVTEKRRLQIVFWMGPLMASIKPLKQVWLGGEARQ